METVKTHYKFIYITKDDSTTSVIPKDYPIHLIPSEISLDEEPNWLAKNYSPESHLIIADGYHFISSYQKTIKSLGYKLIYIDDLTTEYMYADMVINHSPYVKMEDFDTEYYTKLLLGTNYALLRPSFLNEAKKERIITSVKNVFICFGGADPFDLTLKATKAICELNKFQEINIVLGGAYKHQEIFELEESGLTKINIHKNLSELDLIKLMKDCQLAIAPASTILYELCCVKSPILSGFYVDNQKLIYKGFKDFNAVFEGGNFENYTIIDFKNKINEILASSVLTDYINIQKQLFDDKIASRHLNIISSLC